MNYAIIENGKIVNIAVSDTAIADNWIELQDGFSIGDNYTDGVFSKAEVVVEVPQTITPRQLRLQLLSVGLLDEVEALCTTDRAMSIWFEYSLDFQRSHPMIETMAVQLGLTQDDMDNFFIEASKL